jgi:hypothetical protein
MDLDGSPYSLKSTTTLTAIPALGEPRLRLIHSASADVDGT